MMMSQCADVVFGKITCNVVHKSQQKSLRNFKPPTMSSQ